MTELDLMRYKPSVALHVRHGYALIYKFAPVPNPSWAFEAGEFYRNQSLSIFFPVTLRHP